MFGRHPPRPLEHRPTCEGQSLNSERDQAGSGERLRRQARAGQGSCEAPRSDILPHSADISHRFGAIRPFSVPEATSDVAEIGEVSAHMLAPGWPGRRPKRLGPPTKESTPATRASATRIWSTAALIFRHRGQESKGSGNLSEPHHLKNNGREGGVPRFHDLLSFPSLQKGIGVVEGCRRVTFMGPATRGCPPGHATRLRSQSPSWTGAGSSSLFLIR